MGLLKKFSRLTPLTPLVSRDDFVRAQIAIEEIVGPMVDYIKTLLVHADGSVKMTGDLDFDGNDLDNVNAIHFGLTPTHTHIEGSIHWDGDDKTLNVDTEVNGTAIQVGQETVLRATNKTGSQINNGQVVYVNGAQGQRPTVALADADAAATSDSTIGVATSDIANNGTGYVTVFGLVRGLDTSSFTAGDTLWVSSTAGALTNTEPATPAHAARVGTVLYSHATEGKILVSVDTGGELGDIHDVLLTTPASGELINYDGSKWVNTSDLTNIDSVSFVASATSGTIEVAGAAGWRDITGQIVAQGTGANNPAWTVFRNGIYDWAFSATIMKEVWIVFHIDHDYSPGTDIYFHTHWSTTGTNTGTCRWGFEYTVAKGHQQSAFGATTTVYVEQAATGTQYYHMIAETAAVSSSEFEVDALILVRIFRDAAHANDTLTDVAHLITADVHYQADRFSTKNKAPNFYT